GTFTASATATVSYPGLSPNIVRTTDGLETVPAAVLPPGSGVFNSGPAVKKYVDATVEIAPSAVNAVGTAHTFTITVTALPGNTGLAPTLVGVMPSVSPAPASQSLSCGGFVGNVATCTLTINSPTPGTFTANATATVSYPGLSPNIVRTTDGSETVPAAVLPPGSGVFNSGPAVKKYVDAKLEIAPSAVNAVGTAHTFTVTVTALPG